MTKFTTPPFAKNKEATEEVPEQNTQEQVVEQSEKEAPQAPQAPQAQASDEGSTQEAPKQKRERSNTPINKDHVAYVMNNVKKMSYPEMAEALGISKNQVNRILQEIKTGLRQRAIKAADEAGTQAYGQKDNGKYDYSQPQTELATKIEKKITDELSRPAESRPGGTGPKKSKVQNVLDSTVEDILSEFE